ncbi:MAG: 50S ribosomal protein L11 methyltransferase [Akkermansia sp.]|nr:50S ribosomal protein L11 methyltransferase [Akkermansia sp.]
MWVWKKIIAKSNEAEWQERVGNLPGAVFSEGFHAERLNIDVYTENEEEALVLAACYGGKTEAVQTVDWVAATAPENTPPLIIRDRLVISASSEPEVLDELRLKYPERIILSFPAERAFGTGNHATTSTCLRMLCDEVKSRKATWTLADIGCGTGVLALAGLRLGAQSAISFDFDPIAVEVAERNIARNGGADNLSLFQADVFEWAPAPGEEADIVLANLFSTVLQKAFPRLIAAMKPDGVLIISGILNTQAQETLDAAQAAGLKVQKVVSRGKWTTAKLTLA